VSLPRRKQERRQPTLRADEFVEAKLPRHTGDVGPTRRSGAATTTTAAAALSAALGAGLG